MSTDPKSYNDGLDETDQPLVLIHVDGGIAEEWYTVAGTGTPEVHILDFDREGEDEDDRAAFIERATSTLALFKGRGVDTSDLDADVEALKANGIEEDE